MGITDLNAALSIVGSLPSRSNCFNYVSSLIGLLNSQSKTDINMIDDSLILSKNKSKS